MEVSIIIPTYNRREALQSTLQALSRQTYPADRYEVIVVDQASTDGTQELLSELVTPYRLKLIEQDAQYGPSAARNAGVEEASGELLLFLDADIITEPDTIEQHVLCHGFHPDSMVCGRMKTDPTTYRSFIEKSANPEAMHDHGEVPVSLPFYEAFSGHFSISRKSLGRVGLFDPKLRAVEDIEFSYRAWKENIEIWYCPSAVGYHNHVSDLENRLQRARFYASFLPGLYEVYPELKCLIPGYKEFNDIRWNEDFGVWMIKKIITRILSQLPVRKLCLIICQAIEAVPISASLARLLFWRLIQAHGYLGYKDGMKMVVKK